MLLSKEEVLLYTIKIKIPEACPHCGSFRVRLWLTVKYFFCADCNKLAGEKLESHEVEEVVRLGKNLVW